MGTQNDTPDPNDPNAPIPGDGSSPTIRQGPDGQWYELVNGQWQLIPGMPSTAPSISVPRPPTPFEEGLLPPSLPGESNLPGANWPTMQAPLNSPEAAKALGIDPNTFQTVMALKDAGLITAAEASKLLFGDNGPGGGGGSGDPYAGARLAEQVRAQRMQEALAAQNAIQQRIQNAQQARLEGAKMAITPDMAASGYFPGLGPTSPAVHAGLVDPFRFNPVAFNPDQGLNVNQDQVASDLAKIRGAAGY